MTSPIEPSATEILLVEDSPSDAQLLQEILQVSAPGQFTFTLTDRLNPALEFLRQRHFDVMLLDLSLPDSSGADTFLRARAASPQTPIILLTADGNESMALAAVRHGIQDYLAKGHADGSQIVRAIRYAIERKRAEEEREELLQQLAAEKLRWQTMVESMLDPVTVCDAQGRPINMNAAYLRMVGRAITRAVDKSQAPVEYQLFHADGTPFDPRELPLQKCALSGDPISEVEIIQRGTDGSEHITIWNAAPLRDRSGRISGAVATGRDITDLRRASHALRRSNARLDLLAGIASELLKSEAPRRVIGSLCRRVLEFLDCQVFFNFLVDEDRSQLHLNAFAGVPPDETRAIEWLEFGSLACGGVAAEDRVVVQGSSETPDPQTDLMRLHGVHTHARLPLIARGRVLGTLAFGTSTRDRFTDEELSLMKAVADQLSIALERKRAEDTLRFSELRARDLAEVRSNLVSTVSHELKSPLTSVRTAVHLLAEQGVGPLNAKQADLLAVIRDDSERLLRTLNNLLDFARMEEGRFDLRLEACSVDELLEIAIKESRELADSHGLTIRRELPPGLPTVRVDREKIDHVFTNFLNNAIKHTPQSGEILIRAARQGDEWVRVSVIDRGCGIPAEYHQRIFEKFFRVPGQEKTGSGLGLSITREIAGAHGSQVGIFSEPGKGSEFYVDLPIA